MSARPPSPHRDATASEPAIPRWVKVSLLVLVLLALLPGRWREQPLTYLQGLAQRSLLGFSLDAIPGLSSEAMDVDLAADGAVWIASKYGVVRIPRGAAAESRLSRQALRAISGERKTHAISTLYPESADTFWIGGWHGLVVQIRGDQTQTFSTREQAPKGRITDILRHDDQVYVGSNRGLWRVDKATQSLLAVPEFGEERVVELAIGPAGELLVAGRDTLRSQTGTGWTTLWQRTGDEPILTALALGAHDEILVGTKGGFWVLDSDGNRRSHEQPDSWVTAFADRPEGRWVATWQQGFLVPTAQGWRRMGYAQGLPKDAVSDFAVDADGRLWMALYGGGAHGIAAATLAELTEAVPTPILDDQAQIFGDACAAAEALAVDESGQIRRLMIDAQPQVFFDRRRVCPPAPGHSPSADRAVLLNDSALLRWQHRDSRSLPLPERVSAANVTALLWAADDSLWLGTRSRGIFVWRAENWMQHGRDTGLINNPITALEQEDSGLIWAGSSPRFDRRTGHYSGAGLHRWDGINWTHFAPDGGRTFFGPDKGSHRSLAGALVNAVQRLPGGGIAAATNGGLSLFDGERFTSYDRYHPGLPSNFMASVNAAPDGRLWLSHLYWGAGVSWRAGLIFRNVNSRDGLFADRIKTLAHDGDERVWIIDHSNRVAIYRRDRLVN